MKNFIGFSIICIFLLAGCTRNDESVEEISKEVSVQLIGKWSLVKQNDYVYENVCSYFIFREEDKLVYRNCHSYSGEGNINGSYDLVGDTEILFFEYNYFKDDAEAKILEITDTKLIMEFTDGFFQKPQIMELIKN